MPTSASTPLGPRALTINKLSIILETRPDLRAALESAIKKAAFTDIPDLTSYYHFLMHILTHIPVDDETDPAVQKFYCILNSIPSQELLRDQTLQQWLATFSRDYGAFADTPKSAERLTTYTNDPAYKIGDYMPEPGGWLTFNQFFTRRVKLGTRPIAAPCEDNIIVSAADGICKGCWPIYEEAVVNVRGISWTIRELLANSPFLSQFERGVITHISLSLTDYHRCHLPVSGTILEARVIPGRAKDEIDFQFDQMRAIVIIDSPIGYVAAIPIGMGRGSSVVLTGDAGAYGRKGQEFGYFAYGGSDILLLFQHSIELTATAGNHYLQGAAIARTSPADFAPALPGPDTHV